MATRRRVHRTLGHAQNRQFLRKKYGAAEVHTQNLCGALGPGQSPGHCRASRPEQQPISNHLWLVHWRSREKRRERQPINTHQVVRACPSCSHSLLSGGRPGFASRGDMRENVPHPHCFARFHSVLRISFVQLLWSPTAEGFPEVLVLVLCIVMQLWAWRFTSRSYAAPQSKGNTDRRR